MITADQKLVSRLSCPDDEAMSLQFAANAYQASACIGAVRPAFVVVDEDLCKNSEPRLMDCLIHENRIPGLKVILCGGRSSRTTPVARSGRILGRLEKPFDRSAIGEILSSIPVERNPAPSS